MPLPLISLDHVKQFLPVRAGVTDFDAKILLLIQAASDQISHAVRRDFTYQECTDLFHSLNATRNSYDFGGSSDTGVVTTANEQIVQLKGYNIDQAEDFSVYYDPMRIFGDDTLLDMDLGAYFIDYDNSRVLISVPTRAHRLSIKVVYKAGYVVSDEGGLTDLPESLKQACAMQTMYLWNKMFPENVSVANERDGSIRGTYFTTKGGLLPDVEALIAPYRRILSGVG
jgi:hypothetical protein